MTELEIIERLRQRVPVLRGSGVILGIGDDCAIFRPRGSREDLLFTTDLMVQGVHFRRSTPPRMIGHKVLARGLSDIAAMGGEPRFCLLSLAMHRPSLRFIDGFYDGLLKLARRTGTALAGGDISRAQRLVCDIVVCGAVPRGRAIRRDGASPGDVIYVSGSLGRAASRGYRDHFEPRLALGRRLRGRVSACIDLSDGLSLDLHRLCLASRVSGIIEQLPRYSGATVEQALHGGEDYELLCTSPHPVDLPGMIRIGHIAEGGAGSLFFEGEGLQPGGYQHFKDI